MATQNPAASAAKPSPRKKTTKRGPTKATALKTLGLTQEDLETLAELKRIREAVAQQESETAAHNTALFELSRSEPVTESTEPYSLVIPVDSPEPSKGPFFIRNLRGTEVGIRIERQDKGKKRFDLKPRGQRGDFVKIKDEDLEDENLLQNIALGVIEVVTAGEAKNILEKQTTNIQAGVHPAMALLRNPKGEPYVQTEVPVVEDNSYTVAHLKPQGGEAGALPDQGRGIDWAAARSGQINPGLGGNPAIISDGFARPDAAAQADAVARRKDLEGPSAGLGGVSVTIEPTQRT